MDYSIVFSFIAATAALAISPGPDNIFVLSQSMAYGSKFGIVTTAGLMSGCLVHTTLLAFGLSAIISGNAYLFLGIKAFGALYLFYLAYKVYSSSAVIIADGTVLPKRSLGNLFQQGFTMNVLNPKVTIFFLAFFPGFLFHKTWSTVAQFYALGLLFMGVSFIIFSAIALLSGTIAAHLVHSSFTGRILKWFQIFIFVGIGLFLLVSGK